MTFISQIDPIVDEWIQTPEIVQNVEEDAIESWQSQAITSPNEIHRLECEIAELQGQMSQIPHNFTKKSRNPLPVVRGNLLQHVEWSTLNQVNQETSSRLTSVVVIVLSVSEINTCNTSYGPRNVVDVLVQDETLDPNHYFPIRLWGQHCNNARLLQTGDIVAFMDMKPWNLRSWLKQKTGQDRRGRRSDVQLSTMQKSKFTVLARICGGEPVLLQEHLSENLLKRYHSIQTCGGIQMVQWSLVQRAPPKPAPSTVFTCCRNFKDNAMVNLVVKIMRIATLSFGMVLQEHDSFLQSQPNCSQDDECMLELMDEEGSLVKLVLDPTHHSWFSNLHKKVNHIYSFYNLRVRWSPILAKMKGTYYLETVVGLSKFVATPNRRDFDKLPDGGYKNFENLKDLDRLDGNWNGLARFYAKIGSVTLPLDKPRTIKLSSFDASHKHKSGEASWRNSTNGPFSTKWELVRMCCTNCNSVAIQDEREWKCGRSRSPCSPSEATFGWSWIPMILELSDDNAIFSASVGWNNIIVSRIFDLDPELLRMDNPKRLDALKRLAFRMKENLLNKVWKWEVQVTTKLDEFGFGSRSYHVKNVKLF